MNLAGKLSTVQQIPRYIPAFGCCHTGTSGAPAYATGSTTGTTVTSPLASTKDELPMVRSRNCWWSLFFLASYIHADSVKRPVPVWTHWMAPEGEAAVHNTEAHGYNCGRDGYGDDYNIGGGGRCFDLPPIPPIPSHPIKALKRTVGHATSTELERCCGDVACAFFTARTHSAPLCLVTTNCSALSAFLFTTPRSRQVPPTQQAARLLRARRQPGRDRSAWWT